MMTSQLSKPAAKKPKKAKCAICHELRDSTSLTSRWQGIPISELKQLGLRPTSTNGNVATLFICSLDCNSKLEELRMSKEFGGVAIHRSTSDRYGRTTIVS